MNLYTLEGSILIGGLRIKQQDNFNNQECNEVNKEKKIDFL